MLPFLSWYLAPDNHEVVGRFPVVAGLNGRGQGFRQMMSLAKPLLFRQSPPPVGSDQYGEWRFPVGTELKGRPPLVRMTGVQILQVPCRGRVDRASASGADGRVGEFD